MKNLVALRYKDISYKRTLPRFFYHTIDLYNKNENLIVGVAFHGNYLQFKSLNNANLIVINNKDNLRLDELLQKFNISDNSNDIEMFPFRGCDYIYSWKKYKECVNEETARARKSHLKKHQDRKAFENSFLSNTQIERLYSSYNLPNAKGIDKRDYLEFYFYFGNKLEFYKYFYKIKKKANITWKDFRNLRYSNFDFKTYSLNILKDSDNYDIVHEIYNN